MRSLLLLLLILLIPGMASAQQSRLSNTSGAKIFRICAPNYGPANYSSDNARGALDISVCEAYITGVYDTLSQMQQNGSNAIACVPGNATAGVIRPMLVAWLQNHPEDGQRQASAVVLHVLQANFPCNGPQTTSTPHMQVVPVPDTPLPPLQASPLLQLPPMPTPGEPLPRRSTAQTPNDTSPNSPASDQSLVPSSPPSAIIPIPDSP